MAKGFIEDTTMTAIADAIREKTDSTEQILPKDMPTAIQGITGGGDHDFLLSMVDRTATRITAEDLKGLTMIGKDSIEGFDNLEYLEIPDTVTTMKSYAINANPKLKTLIIPESVKRIDENYLGQQLLFDWVKLLWREYPKRISTTDDASLSFRVAQKFLARGSFYDTLISNPDYQLIPFTEPFDEYVGTVNKKISVFNQTQTITLPLQNYTSAPIYTITSTNDAIISISNVSATTEAITFDITSHEIEGTATITVLVNGAEDFVFNRSFDVVVYAELAASTYEVVPIDGAQYGFALNDAGYYESQNKGVQNSYAICRINISNPIGRTMYLDCINYAEANYDFGLIGLKDKELSRSNSDASVNLRFFSFKGYSKADVQTVEYPGLDGNCFIEIKYRKDGSGDSDNDSLQFKIRFE